MIPAVLPAPTTDHPSATRPDDPGAEAAFGDALRRAEQAVCPTGRGDGQPSCEPGDPTEDPGTAPADSTEAPCEPDGVDGEPTAEVPEEDAGRPDAPAGTAAVAITAAAQPAGDARVDPPAPVDGAGDLTGEAAETTVASTVDLPTSPDAPDTAAAPDTVDVPVETTAEPTDLDAPLAAQAEDVTTGTAATAADDHAAEGSGHDAEVPAPAPTPDAGSDVDVRVETADRQVPMAAEDAAPTRSPAAPTTAQVSADAAPAADPGAHADTAMPTTAMPTTAPAPATTGTAAASTPAPATPAAPVAQQLVEHVTPLAGGPDGTHELTIELRPASLGRVQLEVTLQDGVLHVLVQADDPGSRRLLGQSLTDLRAALTEAGVTAGQLDVGDPGSGDARANAETGTDGRSPGTRPRVGAGDGGPADIHPATPQTTSAASVGRGRPTIDVLL